MRHSHTALLETCLGVEVSSRIGGGVPAIPSELTHLASEAQSKVMGGSALAAPGAVMHWPS